MIRTYLKSNVAPFSNQSLEYATTPSELARQSMFDIGLGWTPQRCTFQLAMFDDSIAKMQAALAIKPAAR